MTKDIQLLVSDRHGIYIPQFFCQNYLNYIVNKDELEEQINDCLEGPDNEFYFESWDDITQQVKLKDDNGDPMTIGYLGESGDLWAIPEGYEYPEF